MSKKTNYINNFVYKESNLYNTLFQNPFSRQLEPIPSLVLSRTQVRLNLFVQNIDDQVFKNIKEDLDILYQMIIKLVQNQPKSNKVNERFLTYSFDLEKNVFTTYKGDNKLSALFVYSVLDFIRTCIFENVDEEPVIDLNDFSRITNIFFNLIEN